MSQIAIFFHVPPSLHHTPENTKFRHCIFVEDEFQNEIPTAFLIEVGFKNEIYVGLRSDNNSLN